MYEMLFALTLIFVIAALLLVIAAQAALPVVPFYLIAGVLAGAFIDETQLLDLAQWGIAFLVFLFGVHFDLEAFRTTARISVVVSVLQAGVVGAVAFGAGLAFGLDGLNAGYFAVVAALSSSIVAVSYLDTTNGIQPTFVQLAESIHFVEDLIGVIVVLSLSAVVYSPEPAPIQFATAAVMILTAVGIRYLLFHRLTAKLRGDTEVMMLIGVSFVIGFITLAEFVGLSIVVGAFAAGIAVADDYPHSLELVDTIDDLEDFFSPLFFITVGALLTVPGVETAGYALALIAAVLILNPLVVAFILLRGGFDERTAMLTGMTLDQVSVFSLFIAIEALAEGAISRSVFDAIVLATVITMFVGSYTARHNEAINRRLRRVGLFQALGGPSAEKSQVADNLSDHVIIVDFEQSSQPIIETCSQIGRDVLVIEDNPTRIAAISEQCENYIYGDVLSERLWKLANVEDAALIISLTPETDRARGVVELAVEVPRIVRVAEMSTARRFVDSKQTSVLSPSAIAGQQLTDDIDELLDAEISHEEFADRDYVQFEDR